MPQKISTKNKAVILRLNSVKSILAILNDSFDELEIISEAHNLYANDYSQENVDAQNMFKNKYNCFSDVLEDVSQYLFTIRNGQIYIKQSSLEEFNIYTTSLDIYPIFGYYLYEKSKVFVTVKSRVAYLEKFCNYSFKVEGNLEYKLKEVSDIHVHLGAILDFSYRIHEISLQRINQYYKNNIDDLFLTLNPEIINKDFLLLFSFLEKEIVYSIIKNIDDNLNDVLPNIKKFFENNMEFNLELYEIQQTYNIRTGEVISISNNDETSVELLVTISKYFKKDSPVFDPKIGDELLILLFIHHLKISNNNNLKKAIIIYFIMRNFIKVQIFQQHRRTGLDYFSTYSRGSLKNKTANQEFIFKSIVNEKIKTNIEVRFYANTAKNIRNVFKYFLKQEEKVNISIKSIFHYLRKKQSIKSEEILYQNLREQILLDTKELYKIITNKDYRFYKDIDLVKQYLHGIDVASQELHTPPEIFAPMYMFFKNSILASGFVMDSYDICGTSDIIGLDLQYTYHVGEDFRDIISGLRHMYEAVIFLDLKEEDRIGHGVALGIDVRNFFNDRKKISISKGEYLDNLVFLYFLMSDINNPPYSLEKLKNHINQLSYEIYNNKDDIFNVDDLIDAWLLRRNSAIHIKSLMEYYNYTNIEDLYEEVKKGNIKYDYMGNEFEIEYSRCSMPDFFESDMVTIKRYLTARNNKKAYKLFWKYNTSKRVRNYYTELHNNLINFEFDFYEYIQDYLMENVFVKKDIVIEILPTSNMLITPIPSYDNHPFLRFNSPLEEITPNKFNIRTKKLKIVLGTDDPGIQGTNLIMEYYFICKVVSKLYGRRVAEKYVEELNKTSNYIFYKGSL